jgi:hypothetical protein
MRNSIKISLIVIILVVVAGIFYLKKIQMAVSPSPSVTSTPLSSISPSPVAISDLIQVTTPVANDIIDPSKPLTISGRARGDWYFEASFPVKLVDANGNILSQSSIQTSENWMTEDFVPFEKQLQFSKPTTLTGELILHNDNPSGLSSNDRELRIPLKFNIATTSVKVFFGNNIKNPGAADCNLAYAVNRTVPKTAEVARAALEELLKGVNAEEAKVGYMTSINSGVKIKSLTIVNGIARVDFDQTIQQNVGGSCRVSNIRAQITDTLMQFQTVKSVVISVDGNTEEALQP